jgi:hypothetical protein
MGKTATVPRLSVMRVNVNVSGNVSSTQKLALPPNNSPVRRRSDRTIRMVSGRAKAASARTASSPVSVVACPRNAT